MSAPAPSCSAPDCGKGGVDRPSALAAGGCRPLGRRQLAGAAIVGTAQFSSSALARERPEGSSLALNISDINVEPNDDKESEPLHVALGVLLRSGYHGGLEDHALALLGDLSNEVLSNLGGH